MDKEKIDFEFLKIQMDSLHTSVRSKLAIVPQIAALSATVLVIATFSDELLQITGLFKASLSVLLALIPISLLFYLIEVHISIDKGVKIIEEITKASPGELMKKVTEKQPKKIVLFNFLANYYPFFATILLSLVIVYTISQIWC